MINLLPWRKQKQLRREYRYRVLIVAFVFVVIALGVFATMLGTFYVILLDERGQLQELQEGGTAALEAQNSRVIVADLERKINILSAPNADKKFTDLIVEAIENRNNDIHISEITLRRGDETTIEVRGVADTREEFVTYLEALEGEALFKDIDSPISNLSRSVDINFSIGITVNNEE